MNSQNKLPIKERIFHGRKVKILVLGREEIRDFSFDKPYLVISVTDPEKLEADIFQSDDLIDIVRLKFDDIGKPNKFQFEDSSDILMSSEQATQILEFVKKYSDEVDLIVCQCEQGVSRSAGIAAAISKILQNEDEYFLKNYWANRWVYELLIGTEKNL